MDNWILVTRDGTCTIQVAALALLLAAIGGSDMSVQYIFVIHVGMHQSEVCKLWIVRVVRSWEQHSVCGDDLSRTVMQQSTRYYFHFAFLHQCLHFNHLYSNYPIYMSYYAWQASHLLFLALQWALGAHAHHWPVPRLQWRNIFFLPMHMANLISLCKNSLPLL